MEWPLSCAGAPRRLCPPLVPIRNQQPYAASAENVLPFLIVDIRSDKACDGICVLGFAREVAEPDRLSIGSGRTNLD